MCSTLLKFLLCICCLLRVKALVNFNLTSSTNLADFINNVGREQNMTGLTLMYDARDTPEYVLNDFLAALYRNERSFFAQRPQLVGNEHSRMELLYSMDHMGLIVTFAKDVYGDVLDVTSLTARRRRSCFTIFVIEHVSNSVELRGFFRYLWREQFRRPLVIANGAELYTMMPYPKLQVINVTHAPVLKYFPERHYQDMLGYELKVPVQVDYPHTFWYHDPRLDTTRIDGLGGRVFRTFMQHVNVTLNAEPMSVNGAHALNLRLMTQLMLEKRIEINANRLAREENQELAMSYPYKLTPRCLLLPLENEISRNLYILLPFQWSVWLSIVGSIVVIEIAFRCWMKYCDRSSKNRFLHSLRSAGGPGFLAISIVLALPVHCFKKLSYQHCSLPYFVRVMLCYHAVSFMGFYISQLYSTALKSLMMVTLFKEPRMGIEDFLATEIPIMILPQDQKLFQDQYPQYKHQLERLLVQVTAPVLNEHRDLMNTSYAYLLSSFRWQLLGEQQRFLNRKRFWFSDICFGDVPVHFQLQFDSHFYKPLMYYDIYLHEHGFHVFWKSQCFIRALQMDYVSYLRESESLQYPDKLSGLTVKTLSFSFFVYGVGLTLGALVFLLEVGGLKIKRFFRTLRNHLP